MRVINGPTELAPLEAVRPHPRNPRQGDVGAIHESIEANGFYGVIVAQRSTGFILAGNHRWQAAKQAGADAVPVMFVDVDDDHALRILLADNRTNDKASYDDASLAALLMELADQGDLTGTGYDGDDLDQLLADLSRGQAGEAAEPREGELEELQARWGTEAGQLWLIGRHRLLIGDATSEADAERLLEGVEPRLMVTDPPYGVDYDPTWRDHIAGAIKPGPVRMRGEVRNDDRRDWREAWMLFPGDVAYVWHASAATGDVLAGLEASGYEPRAQIIWRKNHFAVSRGHYHWQHEPCWYAVKKGRKAHWIGDRKQTTVWDIESLNIAGRTDRSEEKTVHGTQKPLEVMARPIRNHAGDVYDPFLGSGTTVIAAERLGRACYAMELDPGYAAVALQRFKDAGLEPSLEGR